MSCQTRASSFARSPCRSEARIRGRERGGSWDGGGKERERERKEKGRGWEREDWREGESEKKRVRETHTLFTCIFLTVSTDPSSLPMSLPISSTFSPSPLSSFSLFFSAQCENSCRTWKMSSFRLEKRGKGSHAHLQQWPQTEQEVKLE